MKITLMVENNMNEDGEDSTVMIEKDGVETVEDCLYTFERFMNAAGFTYIESVTAKSEDREWVSNF